MERVRHYVERWLEPRGIPVLGIIPYEKSLAYPVMRTIADSVHGLPTSSFWGTPIYESYDEWLASPYAAEGVTCVVCHATTHAPDHHTLSFEPEWPNWRTTLTSRSTKRICASTHSGPAAPAAWARLSLPSSSATATDAFSPGCTGLTRIRTSLPKSPIAAVKWAWCFHPKI